MKIAFIFPGQGSQYIGMGRDLYEQFSKVRELYDQAEEIVEFPLRRISFDGPEEKLRQTQFTQPAIFVHSLSVYKILDDMGILPSVVAGHSLGEYSALVAAGALSFTDGLRLVKLRGELMQLSGEKNPGTMAAIMGLDEQKVKQVCQEASRHGIVQPANFNSPGQVVISGSIEGVKTAMKLAKEQGARLVKELPVSGAFHSPLMENALSGLTSALSETKFNKPKILIYSNVTAKPVSDIDEIRDLLKKQLLSSVLWQNIIENMCNDGVEKFLEIGPSKVLTGLNRRIRREVPCIPVGTVDDLNCLKEDD